MNAIDQFEWAKYRASWIEYKLDL